MDLQCKYTSKPCYNERSRKPTGEYHNFCDLHRVKANEAQRRWYTRNATSTIEREKKARKRMQDKLRRERTVKIVDKGDERGGHPVLPRKRGAVTFRNASIAATVLAINQSSSLSHLPPPNTARLRLAESISSEYESHQPRQDAIYCEEIALPSSVLAEAFSLEYDWPLPRSISSPNDVELVSLFVKTKQEDDYVETSEYGRSLYRYV